MTKNGEQEYETFESHIKKTIVEINRALKDTPWSIDVDIRKGSIDLLREFGCMYTYAGGLTEIELLHVLSAMALALKLKQFEKNKKKGGEKS